MKPKEAVSGFDSNPQGPMSINCTACESGNCEKCISERMLRNGRISEQNALNFCACYRKHE